MPRVLNKSKHGIPNGAVYVGRPTKWGNPFVIGRDGSRVDVISQYWVWLEDKITNGELDLSELTGKDLVCWCAPKACHADILLELANGSN